MTVKRGNMDKQIAVLGSTGSIGTQTLEVAARLGMRVSGLTAGTNIDLLERQAREFNPVAVAIDDIALAVDLRRRLEGTGIKVFGGAEGINEVVNICGADTVVVAIVGMAGLLPVINAIRAGKVIALANKETLVAGGQPVCEELRRSSAKIIPVDSEHSAIFQCLMGNNASDVSRILLTCSGGPFRGKKQEELKNVRPEDALKHPNWHMGRKITVDTATLMNKGLEAIEAYWLFGVDIDRIEVVIHPQSIIHSMVEYTDGSVIAQLGVPDMRGPIQFALTYPDRVDRNHPGIDFIKLGKLTFEKPDTATFRCLDLAIQAIRIGGSMPAAMNAANETAVRMFLNEEIGFLDIPEIIEHMMNRHSVIKEPSLEDIIETDREVRQLVRKNISCRR